ncbi:hypothetical protein PROFUN_10667 [Planoprotostelium fungivorum]|uniref:Uncharacterized protein n=1 Tax=Planoprotostelium fungivorum TaxID=1890364 RepID=A0A2P6MUV0_9EUKA|nr:hypothetical protein PROFUN_10667 [Planoprotostelium fungivorum]
MPFGCDNEGAWITYYYPTANSSGAVCRAAFHCTNNSLAGVVNICMATVVIENILQRILNDIKLPEAMAYIVEPNGDLVSTSTGLYPFNVTTLSRITAQDTTLSWINSSFAAYQKNPNGTNVVNYNGDSSSNSSKLLSACVSWLLSYRLSSYMENMSSLSGLRLWWISYKQVSRIFPSTRTVEIFRMANISLSIFSQVFSVIMTLVP